MVSLKKLIIHNLFALTLLKHCKVYKQTDKIKQMYNTQGKFLFISEIIQKKLESVSNSYYK